MKNKQLVDIVNNSPGLWNGKIYRRTIYLTGHRPHKINIGKFLAKLSKENLDKYYSMVTNAKLNYEFKQNCK